MPNVLKLSAERSGEGRTIGESYARWLLPAYDPRRRSQAAPWAETHPAESRGRKAQLGPRRVRKCVRMRILKKPNKTQHDEKREPLIISQNVRKRRGLAPGRLVFVGVCLVGTPGFEPRAF